MRSFFAAVGRILASMAVVTTRWVKRAGEWVLETVRSLPSGGGAVAPDPAPEARQAESLRGDEDALACLRAAAASLAVGKIPDPSISGRLDTDTVRWLAACDDEALRKLVRADNDELRAHFQGRKPIRGVLSYDLDAVAAIERSKMVKLGIDPDADVEHCYAPAMAA